MTEFIDGIVQPVDRIGGVIGRPARLLILLDEGGKYVELVAILDANSRANLRALLLKLGRRVELGADLQAG